MGDVVHRMIRRAAVDQDAGAHPVAAQRVALAQRRRTVGQRALAGQVGGGALEQGLLVRGATRSVGIREVRHVRHLLDLRQRVQSRPGRTVGVEPETESVHAGVQLQEHPMRLLRLVGGQPVDLLGAVHDVPQTEARAGLEVTRLEAALEQQHRAAPAERTDALRLVEVEQGKTVRPLQAGKGTLDAVAVGVGLDDGPDPRIRRLLAGTPQVVRECVRVDQGFDGTGHGGRCERAKPILPQGLQAPCEPGRDGVVRQDPRAITRAARSPVGGTASRCRSGGRAPRANEKRFLHHHGGAVLQLAG